MISCLKIFYYSKKVLLHSICQDKDFHNLDFLWLFQFSAPHQWIHWQNTKMMHCFGIKHCSGFLLLHPDRRLNYRLTPRILFWQQNFCQGSAPGTKYNDGSCCCQDSMALWKLLLFPRLLRLMLHISIYHFSDQPKFHHETWRLRQGGEERRVYLHFSRNPPPSWLYWFSWLERACQFSIHLFCLCLHRYSACAFEKKTFRTVANNKHTFDSFDIITNLLYRLLYYFFTTKTAFCGAKSILGPAAGCCWSGTPKVPLWPSKPSGRFEERCFIPLSDMWI